MWVLWVLVCMCVWVLHKKHYMNKNCCVGLMENTESYASKNCTLTNNTQFLLWILYRMLRKIMFSDRIFFTVTVFNGSRFSLPSLMNYSLLFTIAMLFWYSDNNKIKWKKNLKKMQFRVDIHWWFILWFWLRHDNLLYLKRSRKSRGLNLFSFLTTEVLFSRFSANSLGWVLRRSSWCSLYRSISFFTVSISTSLWIAAFLTYQGMISISLSVFDWNLWIMSRFELQAAFHSCIP